jgi:hypothetical protein
MWVAAGIDASFEITCMNFSTRDGMAMSRDGVTWVRRLSNVKASRWGLTREGICHLSTRLGIF